MKLDKFSRQINSNISTFDELNPNIYQELNNLGIDNSSIHVIVDMVHVEKSYDAFKIILQMVKTQ